MGKDLRILISATLNEGKSIGDINDAIKRIQKHASLQKIKLDIEIGKNLTQTLNSFISSIDKITKATQLQNNALSSSTNSIKNETDAMNRATQATKQFRLEREKVVKAFGEEQYRVQTYGNNLNNNKQIVTKRPNGEVKGNIIETYDYAKDSKDAAQAIERRRQLERNLIRDADKAHYEAFIEKEKREKHLGNVKIQDQVRAYDVARREDAVFNQKRLSDHEKFVLDKARMEAKIADVTRRFGSNSNVKSQIDQLNASFGQIQFVGNYKKALAETDIALKNIVASAKTSGSHIESLAESFKTAISRTITWTLTMGSLYGSLHALQSTVDTIIQIDSQMTQLKRVMSGSTDFEGMLQNGIDLSNELGRTLNQTLDVMIDFARQGFNEVDTTNLSKTALLMQNISEMTPKESVDALTSAMIAFNIESSKSIKIADSINEINKLVS